MQLGQILTQGLLGITCAFAAFVDLLGNPTPAWAQNPPHYPEFGGELQCKPTQRMRYQKDFVQLLNAIKPKGFGTDEYLSKRFINNNCDHCEISPPSERTTTERSKFNEVVAAHAAEKAEADLKAQREQFKAHHERDIKCILEAQRQFPDRYESKGGFSYSSCKSSTDPTNQKGSMGYRPCRTRENAEVMALSLKLVAGCTGMDLVDMFPTLQHEGGFNLNVMSATGAAGIGQLTSVAIESIKSERADAYQDIDDEIIKKITNNQLNPLTGTSCASLKPYIGVSPRSSASDCEVTTPPKNPILSLLLASKIFKYHQTEVKKIVEGALFFLDIEKIKVNDQAVFSESERKKLERALYIWSYNGGIGGVRAVFKDFMRQTYLTKTPFEYGNQTFEKTVTVRTSKGKIQKTIRVYPTKKFNEARVDDLILGFEKFLLKRYPNPASNKARSREVANYLPSIEKQMQKINATIEGSCFHSVPQPPYATPGGSS